MTRAPASVAGFRWQDSACETGCRRIVPAFWPECRSTPPAAGSTTPRYLASHLSGGYHCSGRSHCLQQPPASRPHYHWAALPASCSKSPHWCRRSPACYRAAPASWAGCLYYSLSPAIWTGRWHAAVPAARARSRHARPACLAHGVLLAHSFSESRN
jgi:hypothetical protein